MDIFADFSGWLIPAFFVPFNSSLSEILALLQKKQSCCKESFNPENLGIRRHSFPMHKKSGRLVYWPAARFGFEMEFRSFDKD